MTLRRRATVYLSVHERVPSPGACEAGSREAPKPRLLDRILGAPEVTGFLTSLAVEGRVAASTQNQALSALLFLYRDVLEIDLPWLECCRLRIQDVDLATNQLLVRGGKGDKDRMTMVPAMAKTELVRHLAGVRTQHHEDLAAGAGWVELPMALARKYPHAGREWVWQWVVGPSSRRATFGGFRATGIAGEP
jgi:integrase